jgi:hypothetical protein
LSSNHRCFIKAAVGVATLEGPCEYAVELSGSAPRSAGQARELRREALQPNAVQKGEGLGPLHSTEKDLREHDGDPEISPGNSYRCVMLTSSSTAKQSP